MYKETTKVVNKNSLSFLSVLGLIFITLKLTNYIDWSWWWVLSPFWIPFAIFVVVIVIVFMMYVFVSVINETIKSQNRR